MASPVSRLINLAMLSAVCDLLEENRRELTLAREREEALHWQQRKQAVFDSLARALYANHSHHFISNTAKARTAARLREAAIEYSTRRNDALMRYVEENAARFEQNGSY